MFTTQIELPERIGLDRVAEIAGVSRRTVDREIRRGNLTCHTIGGTNRPRFCYAEDVKRWICGKEVA